MDNSTTADPTAIELRITEASVKDVGRALVRIDPKDLGRLGLQVGDTVQLHGKRQTVAKAMPAHRQHRGQVKIQMDGITRENVGLGLGEQVRVQPIKVATAETVRLAPLNITPRKRDLEYIGSLLDGLPITKGDRIRATLFANRSAEFVVEGISPRGPALIAPTTELTIAARPAGNNGHSDMRREAPSYEDIGGLGKQVHRIREMIELPLRYPEVFERLGISAPKGVLLYGPPGSGKTLIARTIAHETEAGFFSINGPEIIHKFYGESEAHLRKVFEEAGRKGPSIIFLDEIDAIAPQRERVVGDVEKRVVAQLLALMDGLNQRQNVIVIAATNLPNSIDPALRRPGRFDREIAIPIPDRHGRREILDVHSRGMPLASDVDVDRLARMTHGFVGADLEALCRESAMLCLRRIMDDIDFARTSIPYEQLLGLEVTMSDFTTALQEIEPSAIREVFVEVPDVRWTDIGGLGPVKDTLIEAVEWPLKYPELLRQSGARPVKGALLEGPPGCGKTLLAKALATESGVNFISIKGPSLMSKFVGESEKAVRDVFRKARQAAPCIVFFDEIDALFPMRGHGGGDSGVSDRVSAQILTELDGVEDLRGVMILGATNRADLLDPALLRPGRFDLVIEIPLPDAVGRHEIIDIHVRNKPIVSGVDLHGLADQCDGMSGAEIAEICQHAAMRALRRAISSIDDDTGHDESSERTRAQPEVAINRDDFAHAHNVVTTRLGEP
ncbi:MAG: CDC48 family AAA ATPase [Proteobacteria bacterium]|nr:CDC48 family AAA ATPase [Pseudomonadota bacterium]